jgi:hypothetical protein
MNERIRELSDIAYKNHLARNPHSSFGRRADYDKELAELIVRQCAKIVEDSTWNLPHGYKAVDQANLVKEHFGVD